jgi:excisionase family DNA binding protein
MLRPAVMTAIPFTSTPRLQGEAMPEIMTPKEVAQYLKMSVLTVYKHAKQGTIPGFRIGNSWRFDKKRIDDALLQSSNTETRD